MKARLIVELDDCFAAIKDCVMPIVPIDSKIIFAVTRQGQYYATVTRVEINACRDNVMIEVYASADVDDLDFTQFSWDQLLDRLSSTGWEVCKSGS